MNFIFSIENKRNLKSGLVTSQVINCNDFTDITNKIMSMSFSSGDYERPIIMK